MRGVSSRYNSRIHNIATIRGTSHTSMDSSQELTAFVIATVRALAQDKGAKPPDLTENSSLIDGGAGIDSLDPAVVVVRLQERTGKDSFRDGFVGFSTVRKLVNLYAQ